MQKIQVLFAVSRYPIFLQQDTTRYTIIRSNLTEIGPAVLKLLQLLQQLQKLLQQLHELLQQLQELLQQLQQRQQLLCRRLLIDVGALQQLLQLHLTALQQLMQLYQLQPLVIFQLVINSQYFFTNGTNSYYFYDGQICSLHCYCNVDTYGRTYGRNKLFQ